MFSSSKAVTVTSVRPRSPEEGSSRAVSDAVFGKLQVSLLWSEESQLIGSDARTIKRVLPGSMEPVIDSRKL